MDRNSGGREQSVKLKVMESDGELNVIATWIQKERSKAPPRSIPPPRLLPYLLPGTIK
jgi:hypothetical protein